MRVRVRFVVDPPGVAPLRLEAGNTLATLLQVIIQEAGRALSEPLQLSLNKKTVLSTDPEANLSQLGVCAGDVVWVLSAAGPSPEQPATTAVPAVPSTAAVASDGMPGHEAKKAKPSVEAAGSSSTPSAGGKAGAASDAVPSPASAPAGRQGQPSPAKAGTSAAPATPARDTMDVDEAEEGSSPREEAPLPESEPRLTGPSHLTRLLTELGPLRAGTAAAPLPQQAPAGDAGVNQQVTSAPGVTGTRAAPTQQGQQQQQQQQGPGGTGGEELEASVAAVLAGPLRGGPTAHDLLLLAAHAAMLEGGWQPVPQQATIQLPPTGALKVQYQWVGQHASQQGPVAPAAAQPATAEGPTLTCSVSALRMGRFLVIHGAPLEKQSKPENTSSQQQQKASGLVLQFDTVTEVDQGVVMAAATTGQPLTTGVFRSLRSLWVRLRDGLALALCAASHQAAGLSPPMGLLVLPLELKENVLRGLEARDLAALCCTCRELRYLAAEDFLWRPLFYKEFPRASVAERNEAELRGFKGAYAKRVLEKRRAEADARRRAHQRLLVPRPTPMPGGPFLPHMPAYPPNIIGGDYDRFPMMPGMPGTGGMMPGGGGGFFAGGMPGGSLNPRGGGIHGPFGTGGPFSGGRRGGFGPWG